MLYFASRQTYAYLKLSFFYDCVLKDVVNSIAFQKGNEFRVFNCTRVWPHFGQEEDSFCRQTALLCEGH